jgi:hypothetical protein
MAQAATNPKQQAHELIDRMSVGQAAAVGLFKAMLDPVEIALANAPYDDGPLSTEEIKALDASTEWIKHNQGIAHEQVLAELGITQEEIDNYKGPMGSGSSGQTRPRPTCAASTATPPCIFSPPSTASPVPARAT